MNERELVAPSLPGRCQVGITLREQVTQPASPYATAAINGAMSWAEAVNPLVAGLFGSIPMQPSTQAIRRAASRGADRTSGSTRARQGGGDARRHRPRGRRQPSGDFEDAPPARLTWYWFWYRSSGTSLHLDVQKRPRKAASVRHWRLSARCLEGENTVIQKVTWTGGKVPTEEDALFQFLGQPSKPGTYTFQVQQSYSDGSIGLGSALRGAPRSRYPSGCSTTNEPAAHSTTKTERRGLKPAASARATQANRPAIRGESIGR
jgi:hypothetical protein